jgi:hypothetical protein
LSASRYVDFIHDVLITLHENLRELDSRKAFADAEEVAYIDGKIAAYREVLKTLQMSAEDHQLPTDELGL